MAGGVEQREDGVEWRVAAVHSGSKEIGDSSQMKASPEDSMSTPHPQIIRAFSIWDGSLFTAGGLK